jgi:basic membrane lipoprotein Med (substrate-binding protein (PBP1-ABC) superfamily)
VLAFALLVALSGCTPRPKTATNASNSFKVALLTPGPVSDAGWNAAAFDGLQLIKAKLGADTALVQTTSPSDFADAFRDFGSRGFNLIFAHGFEYTDAALEASRDFPKTWFIVSSGSASSANVASLTFKIEEAAYVEGFLAGLMTKSGVAGAIGGIELPAIRLTFEGFRRGFLASHPDGRVLVTYTGSFEDVGAAKEAALAQITQGADFLLHEADAAGLGVFQAATERKAYAFGASRNQNDVAPTAVIASAVTDIPGAFLKIAAQIKDGDFKPGMLEYGMKDQMVAVVFNPALQDRIGAEVSDRIGSVERDIIAGKVALPDLSHLSSPAKPQ